MSYVGHSLAHVSNQPSFPPNLLPLTCSIFVHRLKGDPRMHFEVMPIFKEQSRSMIAALNGTGGELHEPNAPGSLEAPELAPP